MTKIPKAFKHIPIGGVVVVFVFSLNIVFKGIGATLSVSLSPIQTDPNPIFSTPKPKPSNISSLSTTVNSRAEGFWS
ncbi:hypothetical protein ACS0TY_003746 [Phlomoides rotata]